MKAIDLLVKIPEHCHGIKYTHLRQQEAKEYAEKHDGLYVGPIRGTRNHFNHIGLERSHRKSLLKFIDWVLYSSSDRAKWIRSEIKSNKHKGKTLYTYNYSITDNHAVVLYYLINNWENLNVRW